MACTLTSLVNEESGESFVAAAGGGSISSAAVLEHATADSDRDPQVVASADAGYAQGQNDIDPRYSSLRYARTRLATFNHLSPSAKQDLPPAAELAEAGFYIQDSSSDAVTCFWCDGRLRHWLPNEDPWIKHARWFPDCQFVLKMKGDSFVESVNRDYSDPEPPASPANDESLWGQHQQQEDFEVSRSMEAQAAFNLLESVYRVTRNQIRIAIERLPPRED